MQSEQQQTCQGCCGYPLIVVPETKQAFVKSLENTPMNKYSTFSSPDKKSRIQTLKSTSAGRDTSPGRTPYSVGEVRPLILPIRRELSPSLEELELHIEKKRSECNLLREKYRARELGHRNRLAKLKREFVALTTDYKNKMHVLNFIESNIVNFEKRRIRYPERCFSVTPLNRK